MQNIAKAVFNRNQTGPGTQVNGGMPKGGNQPPRNRIAVIALTRIMLPYSPRKNSANVIAEYSTKYPATSSDSPSGRSKGARLVSARHEMKKMTNLGSSGIANQMCRCAITTSVRFNEPAQSSTVTRTKPIETS